MAVGARIQQLREAQNLTIEEVAASTRLRKDVIISIEAENWKKLDLRVFIRNQIRLIANALNANETELLELFDADLPDNSMSYENVVKSKQPELNIFDKQGKSALPNKRNPKIPYLIAGLVAVMAVAVFAFLSAGKTDNAIPESDVTISESATPTDSTSPGPADSNSPAPTESTDTNPNALGVSLVLQASGRSWITASGSAGNSLFSSFLNAGDTITLTDSTSISLVIGDSGVVNVVVNDENLGFLGGSGSPVEITFPVQ
jgi:cytoskeletal protein RodZ